MLFQKNFGPIVLKEDGELSKQIDAVKQQIDMASEPEKIKLKSQLKLLQEGETGEKNILFELKNSGIDMYILHDIRLEDGDRSAQIDFLVVTRKLIFVIESKHLIGDIEIDENNGFIRSYEYYGKKVREGFYSPVTQNQRHLQLIHDVVMNHKKNAIMRLAFDHWFSDYYQSLVLANPKNCIRNYSKDKQISQQVIRADQLISTIKKMNRNAKIDSSNQKDCLKIAENFMEWNVEKADAWQTAFEKSVPESENDKEETQSTEQDIKICPRCGGKLVVRKAKKGMYIGNSFYGCENYPKCRYIQNITVDTSKK